MTSPCRFSHIFWIILDVEFRYLARLKVSQLKRFSISKVLKEKKVFGLHPKVKRVILVLYHSHVMVIKPILTRTLKGKVFKEKKVLHPMADNFEGGGAIFFI